MCNGQLKIHPSREYHYNILFVVRRRHPTSPKTRGAVIMISSPDSKPEPLGMQPFVVGTVECSTHPSQIVLVCDDGKTHLQRCLVVKICFSH
jgi:hypothetical protein